ncbi:MAG TPA: hypothetical protein VGB16_05675 [candidate division Zixibacteria bacterium]
MEEKFYYTRQFVNSQLIAAILFLVTAILWNVAYSLEGWSVWWRIFGLLYTLLCLHYLTISIIIKNKPSVIITDEKIVARSPFFLKHKISFEQIIPTAIIGEKIKLKYKKPNNKEGSFSIAHLRKIDNCERLVDILKQRKNLYRKVGTGRDLFLQLNQRNYYRICHRQGFFGKTQGAALF